MIEIIRPDPRDIALGLDLILRFRRGDLIDDGSPQYVRKGNNFLGGSVSDTAYEGSVPLVIVSQDTSEARIETLRDRYIEKIVHRPEHLRRG